MSTDPADYCGTDAADLCSSPLASQTLGCGAISVCLVGASVQIETSLKYVVEKAKYKIRIHLNRDLGDTSLNPLRYFSCFLAFGPH